MARFSFLEYCNCHTTVTITSAINHQSQLTFRIKALIIVGSEAAGSLLKFTGLQKKGSSMALDLDGFGAAVHASADGNHARAGDIGVEHEFERTVGAPNLNAGDPPRLVSARQSIRSEARGIAPTARRGAAAEPDSRRNPGNEHVASSALTHHGTPSSTHPLEQPNNATIGIRGELQRASIDKDPPSSRQADNQDAITKAVQASGDGDRAATGDFNAEHEPESAAETPDLTATPERGSGGTELESARQSIQTRARDVSSAGRGLHSADLGVPRDLVNDPVLSSALAHHGTLASKQQLKNINNSMLGMEGELQRVFAGGIRPGATHEDKLTGLAAGNQLNHIADAVIRLRDAASSAQTPGELGAAISKYGKSASMVGDAQARAIINTRTLSIRRQAVGLSKRNLYIVAASGLGLGGASLVTSVVTSIHSSKSSKSD